MKKAGLIFTFISCFFCAGIIAQNSTFEARPISLSANFPKKGTYQVVLKPGTDKIDIPNEILFEAEKKREQDNIVYIQYNEKVKIRIFPFSTILSPDFVPYEEYVYEEE